MKKRNTILLAGLLVLGLLASCKKDNNAVVGQGFVAQTEQGNGSRTYGVSDGSNIAVMWSDGDQILVANGSGSTLTYTLERGANSTEGKFASDDETQAFFQPNYVAIYPATNADNMANTIQQTAEGISAIFNLPATQTYQSNSFGEKAVPMVAYSESEELQFKNVLGGLCFPIVGNGLRVTRVTVISATDEALWGVCETSISTDGGDPVSTVSNTEVGKNTVTLDCSANGGLILNGTPVDFYVMVPVGTLESGFTVRAYNGDNMIYEQTVDWSAAPVANFIQRNMIRKVDHDLSIAVTVATVSPTFITMNSAKAIGKVSHQLTGNDCQTGMLYADVDELQGDVNALVIDNASVHVLTTTTPSTSYEFDLTGLVEDKVYYVRAYAVAEDGTILYGDAIPFATRKDYYGSTYNGKLPGKFTVNANGQKVQFSAGNLQYQASTNTWRFADCQFDFVGGTQYGVAYGTVYENGLKCDNGQISQTYTGWIDLFGWGTSGYPHRESSYQPWSSDDATSNYYAYGTQFLNLNSSTGMADWGYNAISNGGGTENIWRSLQGYDNGVANNTAEWTCIFERNCTYRFAHACIVVRGSSNDDVVEGKDYSGTLVPGMMLFPDDFTWPQLVPSMTVNQDVAFNVNQLSEAQWSLLEKEGAVFLPAAGARQQNADIYHLNTSGYPRGIYWTTSFVVDQGNPVPGNAFCLYFWNAGKLVEDPANPIWRGRSVRLVRDVN